MQRRDFLRGLGALAGLALIDGLWQPHRKVFALGAIPKPAEKNYWEIKQQALYPYADGMISQWTVTPGDASNATMEWQPDGRLVFVRQRDFANPVT